MKKLIVIIILSLFSTPTFGQVIFGDAVGTAIDKTSVLMEFSNAGNRGLILPYITDKSSVNTPGSIILDATSPSASKVQYYTGNSWFDLSVQPANVTSYLALQPITREMSSAKFIIGNATSAAEGVLVLESSDKAMILPIVKSYTNVINPSPGTILLTSDGGVMTLAVYNGQQWSFWGY